MNMVTVSVHCWRDSKVCAMIYHVVLMYVRKPHELTCEMHCRQYAVLIACSQPSRTHIRRGIADDMRSAQQRTKPWVWRETCSSSHMAFTFFLLLDFLVCCCNISGFVFLLLRLAGIRIPLLTVSLTHFMTNCFLCFYTE